MQSGFAVLSAGSIRSKNVKNILLKNLLDACVGALLWYFIGYGLAYDADDGIDGHKANSFIGTGPSNFALSGVIDTDPTHAHGYDWISWFFQYAFAAAAATIVSGAVAERCQLVAYLIYTSFITGLPLSLPTLKASHTRANLPRRAHIVHDRPTVTVRSASRRVSGFIYPVVVHWVWDGKGFLAAANPDAMLTGVIDFAGSGVVHMTGGWAALMGAWILGPRLNRWTATNPNEFEGHVRRLPSHRPPVPSALLPASRTRWRRRYFNSA